MLHASMNHMNIYMLELNRLKQFKATGDILKFDRGCSTSILCALTRCARCKHLCILHVTWANVYIMEIKTVLYVHYTVN